MYLVLFVQKDPVQDISFCCLPHTALRSGILRRQCCLLHVYVVLSLISVARVGQSVIAVSVELFLVFDFQRLLFLWSFIVF